MELPIRMIFFVLSYVLDGIVDLSYYLRFFNNSTSFQQPANIGISLSISCHTYAVYCTMCMAFHSRRNIVGRICKSTVCLSVRLIYITTVNLNCVLSK